MIHTNSVTKVKWYLLFLWLLSFFVRCTTSFVYCKSIINVIFIAKKEQTSCDGFGMACDFSSIFIFIAMLCLNIYLPFLWLLFRAILFAQPEFRPCQMLVKTFAFKRIKWCWIPLSSLFIFGSFIVCASSFRRHTWSLLFLNKTVISDWISLVQWLLFFSVDDMLYFPLFCVRCACAYKWNIAFRTRSLDSFETSDRKYVSDFYDKNGI